MDKPSIILSAENQFAREVTLGVIYQMPVPIWYSLIPGMFLFDFIRRNRAISNYTKYYMFLRKLALNAAQSILDGEKSSTINQRIQSKIEDWLKSQNLLTQDLVEAQKKGVETLIKHYKKCLNAEGTRHTDLIENAYKTRKAFQAHINKLEKAENKIDRILMTRTNLGDTFKERLKIEAQQVKSRRNKMLDDIF